MWNLSELECLEIHYNSSESWYFPKWTLMLENMTGVIFHQQLILIKLIVNVTGINEYYMYVSIED